MGVSGGSAPEAIVDALVHRDFSKYEDVGPGAGTTIRPGDALSFLVALLVVALALGLNNFGAAIAIGVSGVDRLTGLRVAAVFGLWDVVMPAAGLLIGHGLAGELGRAARLTGAGVLAATAVTQLSQQDHPEGGRRHGPEPGRGGLQPGLVLVAGVPVQHQSGSSETTTIPNTIVAASMPGT